MTLTADTRPALTLVTTPTDHEVSLATAADVLGTDSNPLKIATVKRYVRDGKLTALGDGVSADSVTTYMTRRDSNVTKTRFKRITRTAVDIAAEMYDRAVTMESQARALKKLYKPTLEAAGAGVHDGWVVGYKPGNTIKDSKRIEADYKARDEKVPTTTSAPSLYVRRVSA